MNQSRVKGIQRILFNLFILLIVALTIAACATTAYSSTAEEEAKEALAELERQAADQAATEQAIAETTLAILPFTGAQGDEGETIAELFSFEKDLTAVFKSVPRTSITAALHNERGFQLTSGMTDPDTIVAIGKQLGAQYVVAGTITKLGTHNLLVISILNTETLQQITGDIQTYKNIEEIRGKLPGIARNIVAAVKINTANLPALAVLPVDSSEMDNQEANIMAQILAIHLIRSARYAVYPRTQSLEQVQEEYNSQSRAGVANEYLSSRGKGTNPRLALSVAARNLGSITMFNASIINLETGVQESGGSVDYENLDDGIDAMEALALKLTGQEWADLGKTKQEQLDAEAALAQAEAKRVAAEAALAKMEEERVIAEAALAKAEQERRSTEQATAAAKADQERIIAEQAAAVAQAEEERRNAEAALAKAEEERKNAQTATTAQAEADRKAAEAMLAQAEEERKAAQAALVKAEQERRSTEQATAAAKADQERIIAEQAAAVAQAEEERRNAEAALAKAEEERKNAQTALAKAEQEQKAAQAAIIVKAEAERVAAEIALAKAEKERKAAQALLAKAEEERKNAQTATTVKAEQERAAAQAALAKAEEERKAAQAVLAKAEQERKNAETALAKSEQERLAVERAVATSTAPAPTPAALPALRTAPAGMALVPAGSFMMGSADGDSDEKPVHWVTISAPFYMSKYEITQKEWRDVIGYNPSYFKGDNLPVEQVNWYEAIEYCNKRSIKEGLEPAYTISGMSVTWNRSANGYRLPTEAEWEYAARGGGKDTYTYAGSNSVDAVAWFSSNSGSRTHPVGTKAANSLGLYDMSGNVREWCWDWYSSYGSGAVTDPLGEASGGYRVMRGGSWDNDVSYGRSTDRIYYSPMDRYSRLGFRVVCQAASATPAAPPVQTVRTGMVQVPAGSFMMGSADGDSDEKPVHRVTISAPFFMSKYEITQKEWRDVMGTTSAQQWTAAENNGSPTRGRGDNYPMYDVSWHEAIEYCNKRSIKEGLEPAYTISGMSVTWNRSANGYRLPTEAEWEWAARSGGKDTYTYAGSDSVDAVAWYDGNSEISRHPVGTKAANSLELYDMSGNVWEWCWDWYGSYGNGAVTDPTGTTSGSDRVVRGGSWSGNAWLVRSANRSFNSPTYRGSSLGFRVVCQAASATSAGERAAAQAVTTPKEQDRPRLAARKQFVINERAAFIEAITAINEDSAGGTYTITLNGNFYSTPVVFTDNAPKTITLKGDGTAARTITNNGESALFTVPKGITLVLDEGIILDGNGKEAPLVAVKAGTVRMNSGSTIRNAKNSGVRVESNGIFTMEGGEISGNTSYYGGGVYVYSSGTFTMQGGAISGNKASSSYYGGGGGVYVENGTFTMQGGAISGNTASYSSGGGGVYVENGTFTMQGGAISGNTSFSGGGVYVSSGTFTMQGGAISGNKASSSGGGVFVSGVFVNSGTFTMQGGEISGNTASSYGGGVFVYSRGTFTMQGGEISGNKASSSSYGGGGGVSVSQNGTFIMERGEISNNTASSYGGGVFVNSGTFTMQGGEISGNTASSYYYGGGVYVENGTFTKRSGGTIDATNSAQSGRVVYANGKRRDTAAGPEVNLDSTKSGSAGGWE